MFFIDHLPGESCAAPFGYKLGSTVPYPPYADYYLADGELLNSDLIDILEEKSGFPDPPDRVIPNQQSGSSNKRELVEVSSGVYVGGGNGSSISDHEICFIQGDLNYRIAAQREDVIRAIAAGEYWKLLEFDQLIKEKKLNPNFRLRSFAEPPESLDYRRYEVNISDLRPISGSFKIHVKSVVPGLKGLVIDHAIDKWMDVENSILKESGKYYSRF
ncbi:hypothetical protein PSHT_09067 [Puccinia striiformis]|uniref:Inositol polyphosphate-related phosphatase domain-containing protein n=1 Tax=Puccinia striiformis TaxID=27350 RepID=A0A2S4VJ82_9BASI|nr:hypothetical protein PSHT_09067 [Puccinia striiformis]